MSRLLLRRFAQDIPIVHRMLNVHEKAAGTSGFHDLPAYCSTENRQATQGQSGTRQFGRKIRLIGDMRPFMSFCRDPGMRASLAMGCCCGSVSAFF